MSKNQSIRLSAALLAVVLLCSCPVPRASACAEAFAVLGGAKTTDYSKVEKVDDKLLKEVAKADGYDILIFPEKLLRDTRLRDALASSHARLVFQSVGDTRSLCMKHIQSMSVIAVLPTSEDGIKKVFPDHPVKPIQTYLKGVRSTFAELEKLQAEKGKDGLAEVVVLSEPPEKGKMKDQLLERVASTKAGEFVLFVCHSDKGKIPLPDGDSVDLADVQKALKDRTGVILTCDSMDYSASGVDAVVTTRRLQFDEVAKAVLAVGKSDFYGGCHDFGQLLGKLNAELNKGRGPADLIVKLVAVSVAGGITTFTVVVLKRGEGEKECSCKDVCNCNLDAGTKEKCNCTKKDPKGKESKDKP
jgi:hypothetical protein